MMQFNHLHSPVISDDGDWIAYNVSPDRGDGKTIVQSTKNKKQFVIQRGDKATISNNSQWVAAFVKPKFADLEKKKKNKPKKDLALLNTVSGKIEEFEKVEKYNLSEDSRWLVYKFFKEDSSKNKKAEGKKIEKETSGKKEEKQAGSELVLRQLETTKELHIQFVNSFTFDSTSNFLIYSIADTSGKKNGLFFRELSSNNLSENVILKKANSTFCNLTWCNKNDQLAFLFSELEEKENSVPASLWIWDSKTNNLTKALSDSGVSQQWMIPTKNHLSWTEDGERLFFGLKPRKNDNEDDHIETDDKEHEEKYIYDIEKILEEKQMDVWHWDDPLIIPQQKKMWSKEKDKTYQAVYFLKSEKFIQLADKKMPTVQTNENPNVALGLSDVPYLKEKTWDGTFNDVYLVDLKTGSREKVVSHLGGRVYFSPLGKFIVFYKDEHWHIYDCEKGTTRNLTKNLNITFANEDHDYPSPTPGYGIGGWVKNDAAVLIYDKYDIWQFYTDERNPINITKNEGRKNNLTFRIQKLEKSRQFFEDNEKLLLTSYHQLYKNYGFYQCQIGSQTVKKMLDENKKYRVLTKAKNKDVFIYTRETYNEFPDIWVSDLKLKSRKKITNVNPQINKFAWGSAELIEWNSFDGIPLQGVLIKPGNYKKGERYPVLVYYYRFFSQMVHEFNQVVVNHRPCFPYYASNGYVVFLPDIRFKIGRPGFSTTKCIVPGIQKLIDLGIADAKAIALHGHSWSGYQTAFAITQTDIFTCAIAGAPVSNMTSAYSGIRWGSGMARQFQYEKGQSRIGGSLWEFPERYIENSPVFFADKINTPLLIMFGDEDGAVPWYQGIELYLAMRRLEKDCIFLQYREEPHHLKKYPNKLDYTIKMKQYLDYYCKGEAAADWIKKGVLYQGK